MLKWFLYGAGLVYLAVVAFVLLIANPFPVLHDYPEWMYQGHLLHELLFKADTELSAQFELAVIPVPNAISQTAMAVLNGLYSPVAAGQIWLGIYFLLSAIVTWIVARNRPYVWPLLFVATIVLGPGFWNGYINFQFGLILFALFVLLDLRNQFFWIFLFSLLIYFSHAAVFAGFVCYVVLAERVDLRRSSVAWALLPSAMLLAWYTLSRLREAGGEHVGLESLSQWVQYKIYTLAKQGPFHNFIQPDGQSLLTNMHSVYVLGFVLNFAVAVLLTFWIFTVGWRAVRTKAVEMPLGLIATLVVLLSVAVALGRNNFGVVNLGERLLIVALVLLFCLAECPAWLYRAWAVVALVGVCITAGGLLVLSRSPIDAYSVERSANAGELDSYVSDIYQHSRHKHFNHRLFIYAELGQYLKEPDEVASPPAFDHETSIVLIKKNPLEKNQP